MLYDAHGNPIAPAAPPQAEEDVQADARTYLDRLFAHAGMRECIRAGRPATFAEPDGQGEFREGRHGHLETAGRGIILLPYRP